MPKSATEIRPENLAPGSEPEPESVAGISSENRASESVPEPESGG